MKPTKHSQEAKRKLKSRMFADVMQSRQSSSMRQIAEQELEGTRYTMIDLRSDRRTRDLACLRFKIFARCYTETEFSLPAIGRFFRKDHTTVLYGIRRHAGQSREQIK